MHRDTVAVAITGHTGKGGHQSGGVVVAAGIAVGLLHRQHHAAGDGHGVDGSQLVHTRTDDDLAQLLAVLAECDVDDCLFGSGNQHFLHHAGFVAYVGCLYGVASCLSYLDAVVAVDVGDGAFLGFHQFDGSADKGLTADSVGHYTAQCLRRSALKAAGQDGGHHP